MAENFYLQIDRIKRNSAHGGCDWTSQRQVSFALLLLALTLTTPAKAHQIPNIFVSGQRLIDQFDPDIVPKMPYSADGSFTAKLPVGGWANNADRIRHIRSIDAESGRWCIHAAFDAARGKSFCLAQNDGPDDESFYEEAIRQLRSMPRVRLQQVSAADLLTEIWLGKWPCGGVK